MDPDTIMLTRRRKGAVGAVGTTCAVVAVWLAGPARVQAWGMDVHRFITGRALDGLPAELRPFYAEQRAFIVEHSVDPDLWRLVDLSGERGPEDANHFLDIDGLDEPPPFGGVPRDWQTYLARYGLERVNRMGRLPWRVEDIYGRMVRTFKDVGNPRTPYASDNVRFLTAVLAHYVEDAHVPFHAVVNYDGQSTNQRGIHARFETELVLRNLRSWKLQPVRIRPIADPKEDIFARLVEGHGLVPTILDADRRAAAGRQVYDDGYYRVFLNGVRPIVERRLSEAASTLASMIVAAWTEAGKPALPLKAPARPGRIGR